VRPRGTLIVRWLLVGAVVLSGCVGPARTTGRYAGKATRTANDAISALQTAALAVQTSERGRMLGPYLNVVLTGAESDFNSVQQTFNSIQPPDTREADTIRNSLDKILTDGSDVLAQLRILARRGDQVKMVAQARSIPALVDKLDRFVTEVSG
jgi:hypothetical protein